ncbi:MAG: bifunctional phosphopantothenoylcysteine decarboxylase/phosphopantothenate--cysteine ligase CoaBC [Bacteroidia bacterium]|nr:bifunctional phosphopantothenoylcysteine decarboxylase/phosphopantothenate--cysteine ligase CoaBC [Bacteroidia bacterium]
MLRGKKILLGICGSIAAYKAAILTRLLVKQGAEVQVIMTHAAAEFITPLSLSTLSKNPVQIDFIRDKSGVWNNHVALSQWADALLIAPATAHSMAKAAWGLCDNLLSAVYLSAKKPVFWSPAMDLDMYQHPSTQENIRRLRSFGNHVIPSEFGELASGLVGEGRMAEPENILRSLESFFHQEHRLKGKKALVTAGPTQETIDPVRFISNHSSGKMGYALAHSLAKQGAEVQLISGPTVLEVPHPRIVRTAVLSAQEMYEATAPLFEQSDIIVLAAAVADFTPEQVASQKIKKQPDQDEMLLRLKRTVDIAQSLGERKTPQQCLVGFALETDHELENARKKLIKKNFDLIVLNSLRDEGAGFGYDTNQVTILNRKGEEWSVSLKSKAEVADEIVERVLIYQNW